MAKDSRSRSIAKSVTYRTVTIVADLVVVYTLTHRLDVTLGVTAFTNVASTVLYYGHERVWNYVGWGRRK